MERVISSGGEAKKLRPIIRILSIFLMECNASCYQKQRDQNPFVKGKLSQKEKSEISKYFPKYPQHGGRNAMWPFMASQKMIFT